MRLSMDELGGARAPAMRTVVWSARFGEQLLDVAGNALRADELMSGAEWALSRDPEAGCRACGADTELVLPMHSPPGAVIHYVYDDDTVTLLRLGWGCP